MHDQNFMSSNCRQSCELCMGGKVRDSYDEHENKNQDCNDMHPQCEFWANERECVLNSGYMLRSCRLSCHVCINIKSMREKGINELEM
jgi:ShK domain-like